MELIPGYIRLPKALDAASVTALSEAFAAALQSDAPVVTLVGHDADTFCAGVAIDAVLDGRADMNHFADLLTAMHASPKPLLAAVDGAALGGGLGLACACDWVVATDRSTFGLPELLWGLAPAIIWPVITDRMAPHVARQWTVSAYARGVLDAHAAGVVDDVVAAGALGHGCRRATRLLERVEPHALERLRAWARVSRQYSLPDAVARGVGITADLVARPAVQQRWRAYLTGDAPWSA